ncbi:Unknown protein sequence [Pseudomonas syringae pv. cilantro]|uniref:Uncharacterized protein n=1 Tax=Pseudomonas syringae pv. cilantro TaxID=81035 RepID=A0A0N0GEK5_PSESX|nr:Unknown protein sequence [Pseudomonas syringae pv. cilantro]
MAVVDLFQSVAGRSAWIHTLFDPAASRRTLKESARSISDDSVTGRIAGCGLSLDQ